MTFPEKIVTLISIVTPGCRSVSLTPSPVFGGVAVRASVGKGEMGMNIMAEVGLIFGICLAGVAVEAVLPVAFPASVISLMLLMALLFTGVIKTRHIQRVAGFLVANMSFFFLPSCVGIMEHLDVLAGKLLPVFAICFLTTPLIYLTTAWTVQGMMLLRNKRKGGGKDV